MSGAFAQRVVGILNQGALALMLSIGHRAGLFDALHRLGAATSPELADEAGLVERYVREWLGAMTTGGILEYEPATGAFRLPPEHAASLTREAPRNLAATAQWIPLLAGVEDQVLACFERGGGVPVAAYERFHQVMAEDGDRTTVEALAERILPLVPGLHEGLQRGLDVLDVGCGSGGVIHALARRFPRSRFTGFELAAGAIGSARVAAEALGLRNVHFEVRDVADLELRGAFDLVTAFDAIHDQARPLHVLHAIARALRPAGVFLMQEIRGSSRLEEDAKLPLAPFFYTVSCLHCLPVALAEDGAGLGAMWGEQAATRVLAEAGFGPVEVRTLPQDPVYQYYLARRPG
jgi:SAM-dependent methyltransferase